EAIVREDLRKLAIDVYQQTHDCDWGTAARAIPGLNDLLMLGKAYFHATEQQSDGEYVWDKVIVDAPATGHGVFLLQIPSVITSTLSSGHMYEEAQKILDFLRDPERTVLNLVTLAEEMPFNETLMLKDQAREQIGVPVGNVVINGLYPALFDDETGEWLEGLRERYAGDDAGLTGMLEAAAFRRQRIEMQRTYVERLHEEMAGPFFEIPHYFADRLTFPNIASIAEAFETQAEEHAHE
ncbi:MAG: ArsA-related P-loop ATPase, partial [Bradymonadaceae bacterium]